MSIAYQARPLLMACVAVAVIMAGCAATPAPKYYLLSPARALDAGPARDVALGVGPIRLAEYLDRREVVTRTRTNELSLSERHRWAEPLEAGFARVLGDNLGRAVGTQQVAMHPFRQTHSVTHQVAVDVLRFDAGADGAVHLEARWSIVPRGTGSASVTRRSDIVVATNGPDYDSIIDAEAEAVLRLSGEIAEELVRRIPPR